MTSRRLVLSRPKMQRRVAVTNRTCGASFLTTNTDRVLDYLRLIAPRRASNEEICARTGIRPHQQIFQITKRLSDEGAIRAIRSGKEWEFWVENKSAPRPAKPLLVPSTSDTGSDPAVSAMARTFEVAAQRAMSNYFGVSLSPGRVGTVPKLFDLVSEDQTIVGDAKFYTMVRGAAPPPAKYSVIAEHVWLLEKTSARSTFLVFGNDRRVPEQWLNRYSRLVVDVSFFFLARIIHEARKDEVAGVI